MPLLLFIVTLHTPSAFADDDATTTPAENIVYAQDFTGEPTGDIPLDFLVVKGDFEVRQDDDGNKFLHLPGAPLDRFEVVFGPNRTEDVEISAAFRSERSGRRYPEFSVGLGGRRGWKIQLAPARGKLELLRDVEIVSAVDYAWNPDGWTMLSLAAERTSDTWTLRGTAWPRGATRPETPQITHTVVGGDFPSGQLVLAGSPYSGKPIDYDDIKLLDLNKKE